MCDIRQDMFLPARRVA